MVVGLVVGLLSIRLGDLYVALVTLTFGLLVENLVFTLPSFVNQGLGADLGPPQFCQFRHGLRLSVPHGVRAGGPVRLELPAIDSGLAMNAVRWSDAGAKTTGISVVQMKVTVGALGALVAGIGGGLLAVAQTSIVPNEFATFLGVVWLAVLVTIGVRSATAALLAGLSFVMLPALTQAYLPSWVGNVPPILFGLGAISAAKYPEGALAEQGRLFRRWLVRMTDRHPTAPLVEPPGRRGCRRRGPGAGRRTGPEGAVMARAGAMTRRHRRSGTHAGAIGPGRHRAVRRSQSLFNVDLDVAPGSIAGLVGPNGAGKTTMLAVLSGLQRPTEGQVWLHGNDVTHASPQARATQGLARTFQQPELFLGLTVREHLVLAHRVRFERSRLWRDMLDPRSLRPPSNTENERIDGLLELLNLTRVAKAPVAALPLGISRLVEVGRALASDPQVILLDEPLSGLDMKASENLLAVFRRVVTEGERRCRCSWWNTTWPPCSPCPTGSSCSTSASGSPPSAPEVIRRDPAVRAAYLGDEELPESSPPGAGAQQEAVTP